MGRPTFSQRFIGNLGYKAAALLLATLVWYIVQGEEILEVNAKLDVKVEVSSAFSLRDSGAISRDVTLRGPRVLVGAMSGKALAAIIRVPSGKVGSLRYRLDKEFIPNWDNRVRITIHDPYVTLQVEDRLTKKVPVKPIILGEVAENQMIDEVTASPNEVEISGPKSDIGRITELTTDPIDVSGLAESKSIIAAISKAALPELQLSSHEVNVSIKLGPKKLSKNLSVIPIEIVGSEKVGSVRPAGVSVVIAVPESQFHKLNQKDIRASVNAKELEPGRYELAVFVAAPEGIVVQQISPKNVTVEIYNQRKLRP
jgi:hypothetical protein